MKKLLLLSFCLIAFVISNAQVDVTATGGTLSATYTTLKGAFDAINLGTHTGTITIGISADATETASAVLNASGGSSSYSSITISPTGGAARTISGNIFGALIDLNGADNVTIDGLNSGSNSLTISNTGTTSASTIRFINDATNNVIQKCTIYGASVFSGVITFAGGTVSGNDGNNINNCNIGPTVSNFPYNGVYSMGTSSPIDNSGNTISDNNIYDFFNADNATNGININSGNSTWTISNNKIYQTNTRTYTTGSTHNGIVIISGSGYTITGNVIGYATSSGSGTYTMTGTVANRFVGINLGVGTTATTSVQGNTIAGFSLTTSSNASTANGIWCGINLTSGNAIIGTVTGNTIGSGSGTGSVTTTTSTTAGLTVGINCSSTGSLNISNNTIGSIDVLGSSTSISASVTGIQVTAGTTPMIDNNIINNLRSTTLATTGTQIVYGINVPSSGTVSTATSISNNTISNLYQSGLLNTSLCRGIQYGGTGFGTISSNVVNNIYGATASSTLSGGATGVQGICYTGGSTGALISLNTIYTICGTNSGNVATSVSGIGYSNPTGGVVTRNKIFDLRNAAAGINALSPGRAIGISIRAALGTGGTFSNNMISLGDGQSTNTLFMGFNNSFNTTLINIYHNSVYISGTVSDPGANPSFGFYRGDLTTTPITTPVDIRNNIFVNTRSGNFSKHYAISNNYGATSASATGWGANASNYNFLNAAASTVGYWNSDQTFTSWKTASAGDGNSYSGYPITFLSPAVGDLHINMGVTGTVLESGGATGTGITVDYDNQTRPGPAGSVNGGATAPDIGADEFDGVPLDVLPPTISYTLLPNTNLTTIRQLIVTVTDANGVPTTTPGWPNLFWKINSGAWTAVTPSTVAAPNYTFDFGAGVSLGDVVYYYVVAQDGVSPTPNVGAYPFAGAGGFTFSPPAAGTPPTTPSSYSIVTPLSGPYTVGSVLFNKITGRNITFEKSVQKVMKEVTVETPAQLNQSAAKRGSMEFSDASANFEVPGEKQLVEVEEVTWIPMENGKKYEGSLYVRKSENPSFIFPEGVEAAYATITAAINDLNARGVSGATTFLLTDASYTTETLPLTINVNNINLPTATNTIRLSPNSSVTSSISGASASNPVFKILNSYFSIDGSNVGSTDRSLTITNTSTTSPNAVVVGSTGTTPITNVTVKNCILINGSTGSSAVVVSDGSTIGNAGYFSNITIQNNSIQKAYIGVYNNAVVSTGNGSGLLLTGNDLNTSGTNSIRLIGIYVAGVDGATVTNNSIANIANTLDASNVSGIWMASGTINSTVSGNTIATVSTTAAGSAPRGIIVTSNVANANVVISGNTINGLTSSASGTTTGISVAFSTTNVTIEKNIVSNVKNTNTGGWGCNGIQLASTSTAADITVANNMVFDVAAYGFVGGTLTDNGYGIIVNGGAGYKIYYNSVNMNTNQTVAGYPAAFNVTSSVTTAGAVDARNNLFINNQTQIGEKYAVYSGAANTVYSNINFNNYFTSGTNLGFLGANQADLTAWQTATGQDANSKSVAVTFNLPTDLHLVAPSIGDVNLRGTPITGITTDFDNQTRNAVAPYMGADERPESPLVRSLNLTALVQEFYRTATNDWYPDVVTAQLRETTSPWTTVIDQVNINLDANGVGTGNFFVATDATNYYLVIKHRNSLETWSKNPVQFTSGALAYDFTTAATQAYGDNLVLKGGEYCMYSGDINQDGSIDALDRSSAWNDRNLSGYQASDVNGDGTVDALDRSICWNNRNLGKKWPGGTVIVKPVQTDEIKDNVQIKSEN